jgi:hypothetical protein
MSRPQSVLEIIRVARKDIRRDRSGTSEHSDTQHGLSTGRLAALFPALFAPAEEDGGDDPFFMS